MNRKAAGFRFQTRLEPVKLFCVAGVVLLTFTVCAQRRPAESQDEKKSAKSETSARVLQKYVITPSDLPPPRPEEDSNNPPRVVPMPADAKFTLPPGFEINLFAEGDFQRPRWLALAPNGDVFLADSRAGSVIVLRDKNGDGVADERFTFASGLTEPFGLAFWRDYLYVGNTNAVVRFSYKPGMTAAQGQPEKITDLPGKGHWTRTVIFNPAGTKLYVSVGSQTNVSPEPEPRACIIEMNPDGSGRRIFACGLRNATGMAFNPSTRKLWANVQERDRLGDDLVPEYTTEVKDGGFYGWPYAYIGQNEDPRRKGERPDLVKKAIVPDLLIQAHSSVMGLVFYDGKMFPQEYRGDAFIALRGSWNRSKRTGYKIIRAPFKNGKSAGGYEDFLLGWLPNEDSREVWGRPVGLLVINDGSLLIVDDGANKIWRVSYRRPA